MNIASFTDVAYVSKAQAALTKPSLVMKANTRK